MMLKKISTIGVVITKSQQKIIKGGHEPVGGCPRHYGWYPPIKCCRHYIYNCCYGTPECPAPWSDDL